MATPQMTVLQQYIHSSRYARWLPEKGRRETWDETVDRYVDFFDEHLKGNTKGSITDVKDSIRDAIFNMEVMPSMRAMMTAGPALERENVAGYNCSFVAVDSPRAFDEALYILMNGTGVGFSVETQHIEKLPVVAEEFHKTDSTIIVADSKLGWAKALKELVAMLYAGQVPNIDTSNIRPAGSPLKVFGGRASGPEPLVETLDAFIATFSQAAGRKLTSLECHDLMCHVASCVVVGGVRRAALISLSDLTDERMRHAKTGQWYTTEQHRSFSNNSAVYREKPDIGVFMAEWLSLYNSKSGERGIVNREALKKKAAENERRDSEYEFGVNPCSEIILRPNGFCNLSEVVIRESDTIADLERKVELATIIGTMQSTLTKFKYLRADWKNNAEEERLLGVSLTGIMDNKLTNGTRSDLAETLSILKEVAIETNKVWSKTFGIPQSTAITTVKPSGTVSVLVDSASGIHSRFSPYYIRTVRADKKDPASQFMIDRGVPVEDDIIAPDHNHVFSFPVAAPKNAVVTTDLSAIEQLERWLTYKQNWCEHNPSCTVTVKEHEWVAVGAWVYEHFNDLTGVSFLPHTDHIYKQAPFMEIDKEKYVELNKEMPKSLDWTELGQYEDTDQTVGSQTMACTSGSCEVI
ncbi:MAG: ribonucleoside-triphosphate reductase [Crocinitomicaceae bacterium]|nr:ribonucleoside-triphosphate reductase [Crocinitomicaceae bacterium]